MLQIELVFKSVYFFSRLPFPVSLKPLAKGLLSIFSCVIFRDKTKKGSIDVVLFYGTVLRCVRQLFTLR